MNLFKLPSTKLLALIVILLSFTGNEGLSRHIIGGEITYECLGLDSVENTVTFRFEVRLYRDCQGGGPDFDGYFNFGIFYDSSSGWQTYSVENVILGNANRIMANSDNPCVIIPGNVCVEEGVYVFIKTLPIRSTNYMVSYQRCCRNNTISNIYDPGGQGAAYFVEITPAAQRTCNNSPSFRKFPPLVICLDEELNFDHGANDLENDSLVYEFCSPRTAGGQMGLTAGTPCIPTSCDCPIPDPNFCPPPYRRVQFRGPLYHRTTPLGGNPVVAIDSTSGIISGTPREEGQFVVGVCVSEYRNGELMSTMRRDFQFNVTYCEPTVVAQLMSDDLGNDEEFIFNSCGQSTLEFINESFNEQFIDTYLWIFNINGRIESFNTQNVTITFPDTGQYTGIMIINEGTTCSDTAEIKVNIYPDITADFAYEYDTCLAGPVVFDDLSESGSGTITNWMWDFGDGNRSSSEDPEHLFLTPGEKNITLTVKDVNDCEAEVEQEIMYYPIPRLLIVEPTKFVGCAPADIEFVNLSVPIDETYDLFWDFGDGGTSDELNPRHLYEEPGVYTLSIEVTSPIGCHTQAEFPDWITVDPSPEAAFTCSPEVVTSFDKTVYFTDQSAGAISWQWNFGGEAFAFDRNPTHTFQDSGRHLVELIVAHPSGCTDTAYKEIDVIPKVIMHLPNAFTPNGDGNNETFLGVGVIDGLRDYRMSIWNRWGEMVFYSEDPTEGWDGTKNNTGERSMTGVYVYEVVFIGPRGEQETLKGYVTLMR